MPLTSSKPRIACAPADAPGGGDADAPGGPRVQRPLVPGIPSRRIEPNGVVTQQARQQGPTQQHARDPVAAEGELVVGQGIAVTGGIANCRRLVVHGTVRATVPAQALEVGPEGIVEGRLEVAEAKIAGRFDGDLLVDGTLTVAAGGVVKGRVRYRDLTVEPGGHVSAQIDHIDNAPLPEAEPAAASDSAGEPAGETEPAAEATVAADAQPGTDQQPNAGSPGVPPAFSGLAELADAKEGPVEAAVEAAVETAPEGAAADKADAPADAAEQDAERFYRSLARTGARV